MNKPEYKSQNESKLSNMPPRPHQAKGKKKVNPAVVGGAVAGAAVLGVGGTAAAMSLSDDDNEEELPEEDILDLDSQEEEIVIGDGSGAGNGESIISHISVSYTHLDVYKRQLVAFTFFSAWHNWLVFY